MSFCQVPLPSSFDTYRKLELIAFSSSLVAAGLVVAAAVMGAAALSQV
jgi:hypothetical protein